VTAEIGAWTFKGTGTRVLGTQEVVRVKKQGFATRRHFTLRLLIAVGCTIALLLGLSATGTSVALPTRDATHGSLRSSTESRPVIPNEAEASNAATVTYVFQQWVSPDVFYAGVSDTQIDLYDAERNFGGETTMRLHSSTGGRKRLLIKFDISRIAPPATVVEATLHLYAWYRSQTFSVTAHAYRVRRHWAEEEANWNQATSSDLWSIAGCQDPLADHDPAQSDSATLIYTERWYTWDLTDMAQEWVNNPSSNEGVLIVAEGLSNEYQFRTSDSPSADVRPYLMITVSQEPTPSPTTPPTPSQTATVTSTPTNTPTPTISPTPTNTGPPTSTATQTQTPTVTPTLTQTPLPVLTPLAQVFQQGLYPSYDYAGASDTFLSLYRPNIPWGSDDGLRINGRDNGGERAMVRFDLDGYIPRHAHIHSAKLALFAWSRRTLYGLRISAYDVLRSWSGNEATWHEAHPVVPWGISGCDQVGNDRAGDAAASRFAYFTNYFYEWDITELVQRWVADPETNHGVILIGHPIDQDMRFHSSEWRAAQQRPKLSVVYTAP
jgi:hypothetical protein